MVVGSTEDRTRIGLVGVNERARRLILPGLLASPRARVVAICSRQRSKASELSAHLGAQVLAFSNYRSMLHSGVVDAVFVNTPVDTHFELCIAAIEEGCAVICEKPLAASTVEAVELRRAAQARGVHTAVNFTYRSVLGYRLTERLLSASGIGRPLHAEFAFLQGHNFDPSFGRASALLDSGVHLFDLLLSLSTLASLGPIAQVCATSLVDGSNLDFGWGFVGRTTSGVGVTGLLSRSALGWRNGLRWSLHGTEGALMAELDTGRTELREARRSDTRHQGVWRSVPMPADLQEDEARFPVFHMDRLVGAVRGEGDFPGFAAAEATHRFADALAASAASGQWVAVSDLGGEQGAVHSSIFQPPAHTVEP